MITVEEEFMESVSRGTVLDHLEGALFISYPLRTWCWWRYGGLVILDNRAHPLLSTSNRHYWKSCLELKKVQHPRRSNAAISPMLCRSSSQRLMWGNCSSCFHFLLFPFLFPPPPESNRQTERSDVSDGIKPSCFFCFCHTDRCEQGLRASGSLDCGR